MIKFLFIFILLLLLAGLFALRYRRHIQSAVYVLQMFKKMRQMNKPQEKQITKAENLNDTELVRCAKCGTWTSPSNALKLRSKSYFCSTNCMESAVKV